MTLDDDFCVNALKSALRKHKTPEIFNTDQGAQYTGKAFTGALKDHGVQISMDGKGRCMDNIFIERLWRSVKYEKIFLEECLGSLEIRKIGISFIIGYHTLNQLKEMPYVQTSTSQIFRRSKNKSSPVSRPGWSSSIPRM